MNDLITIVVPVYNVEKYLPHTLESICGQTYTNLQILLIDDGSTDDSLAVCHKWARQDNRIQVYEQEIKVLQGQEIKEYNWQQENM